MTFCLSFRADWNDEENEESGVLGPKTFPLIKVPDIFLTSLRVSWHQISKDKMGNAQGTFRGREGPLISGEKLPCFCLQNGETDITYFSEDCFHFSGRAHDFLAKALWNSMVIACVCPMGVQAISHSNKHIG